MSSISRTYFYFFITIFALGMISAYPIYQALVAPGSTGKTEAVQEQSGSAQTVSESVTERLNHEHEQCLEDLRQAFSIDKNEWKETRATIQKIKRHDNLKGTKQNVPQDNTLASKIRRVLIKHHINPDRVTVEYVDKPNSACHAMAGQAYSKNTVLHFLQINTPVMEQESDMVQKALLTHDIMHLLNYDSIEQYFIELLLKKHGIGPEVYLLHPAFDAYNKHIEFRADLLAACTDLEVAQGLQKAFELHIEKYPHASVSKSHPSSQARLDSMNQLIAQMNLEQKTISA